MKRLLPVLSVALTACVSFEGGSLRLGLRSASRPTTSAQQPARSEPTPDQPTTAAAPRAVAAPEQPRSEWETLSDADFAARLALEYLGTLHQQVTGVKQTQEGGVAEGTLAYSKSEAYTIQRREIGFRYKDYQTEDLDRPICLATFVDVQGLSPDDEDVKRLCERGRFAGSEKERSLARWLVNFELLLAQIPDAAKVQPLREEFVRRLGWTRTSFNVGSRYASHFVEVAPEKWSYRTLRFAVQYAKKHQLDAALVKALEATLAKTPRVQCVMRPGILLRPYDGAGAYGPPKLDYPDYREETPVDCKLARSLPLKPEHRAALPPMRPIVGLRWLAVKTSGNWEVHRNDYGVILNKWMAAEFYWEQEN